MSKTNSLIAGVAGAAIASAIWYFAGNKTEETPTNPNKTEEMASSLSAPGPACPLSSRSITFSQAQTMVNEYLYNGPCVLTNEDGDSLKGWYVEKCIIDSLFSMYPNADGLQLYIGRMSADQNRYTHNLLLMASQLVNSGGQMLRENCVSLPNSIVDHFNDCPLTCPEKNKLP